jgi:hypothetical protein
MPASVPLTFAYAVCRGAKPGWNLKVLFAWVPTELELMLRTSLREQWRDAPRVISQKPSQPLSTVEQGSNY